MVGLLFPGQGSQFVGMGRDLADRFPVARQTFQEADDVLGFSLSRLAWDGPEEELTETRNAQPAILVHSVAVHRLVAEAIPDVALAAGHSLGEFSAYVAAGALAFPDAVRTVRLRGELMFRAGEARPGTMAALLGLADDEVERICRDAESQGGACVPANYNAPGQIVISGDVAAVERALAAAKQAGARRALPLNVSGAFHSPLMEATQEGLAEQLSDVHFSRPAFPIVSNVTGQPVSEPAEARRLLVRQLTAPVRWTASVQRMRQAGIDEFLELGPGTVLTGLVKRVDREAAARAVGRADEVESFLGS